MLIYPTNRINHFFFFSNTYCLFLISDCTKRTYYWKRFARSCCCRPAGTSPVCCSNTARVWIVFIINYCTFCCQLIQTEVRIFVVQYVESAASRPRRAARSSNLFVFFFVRHTPTHQRTSYAVHVASLVFCTLTPPRYWPYRDNA